jgi:hypothetical protein
VAQSYPKVLGSVSIVFYDSQGYDGLFYPASTWANIWGYSTSSYPLWVNHEGKYPAYNVKVEVNSDFVRFEMYHSSDHEECRPLGYKRPVRTSQETHYISATEAIRLKKYIVKSEDEFVE